MGEDISISARPFFKAALLFVLRVLDRNASEKKDHAQFNNLAEVPSRTIYVNSEQSPKPRGETSLEQRSIDLAFKAAKPRKTKYIFTHKNWKICCLSG